jgi:predicted alpha/beta-fold hydrolase
MKLPSLSAPSRHRAGEHHRALWAGLGAAGTLATAGLLQAAHSRRIARDPENEVLDSVPKGRAQSIRSADGTRLHVEVFGPDDGDTVVLAHGWTEALRFWIYVIRRLERKGFRVVAYDLRGHGDSQPADGGDYAIHRFGEDLEAVIEGCVPPDRRAVVAGHSLGAMSIASWAEEHDVERRVRAAALLNTGVGDLIAEHLLFPLPGIA